VEPQVTEKGKPRLPHPIAALVPGLIVREPRKSVLLTPTFEQLSVMNAFALLPLPSFVSLQRVPLGVTTT
jgi:hypothetical protein